MDIRLIKAGAQPIGTSVNTLQHLLNPPSNLGGQGSQGGGYEPRFVAVAVVEDGRVLGWIELPNSEI